ncbi:MAG: deoxyribodipyrimidine photo-lyase, partial [Chitinivibrionales bacterium]|nr:deoxyribodipyrimidine photo-lyase [Chitinivibrionales bacterium]
MIHPDRIRILNSGQAVRGDYVLYWMQQSQRAEYNHALEYAAARANEQNKPLVAFFDITDSFPDANRRHYYFMLQGLADVRAALRKRGIQLVVQHISPDRGACEMAKRASMCVVDRGYLAVQKKWRQAVARTLSCPLVMVESDVIVPVERAAQKEQFSAATFRPKIHKHVNEFLRPCPPVRIAKDSLNLSFARFNIDNTDKAVAGLAINNDVPEISRLTGGTGSAKKVLAAFIREKLDHFGDLRNDPSKDFLSGLSPYLHFGQLSALYAALKVSGTESPGKGPFLEELIVRRELSMNFVHYNPHYGSFRSLPDWAKKTLADHAGDKRPYRYSAWELEKAKTHDPYWNAAQQEMVAGGKMHGYMRMYWGKKILEWSESPEKAWDTALRLNNKYSIDGRDANGFTGIAWCFGKHDRAWTERPVFGKVRYMNENGLRRKFDIDAYVR